VEQTGAEACSIDEADLFGCEGIRSSTVGCKGCVGSTALGPACSESWSLQSDCREASPGVALPSFLGDMGQGRREEEDVG
jgi:hypothetical protein